MLKIDIEGITTDELLRMALIGLEQMHREQTERIAAIMARLRLDMKGNTGSRTTPMPPAEKKPHRLSPEARARIIAGQKKRWEKVKKEQAGEKTLAPRKRGRPRLTEQAVA
jgi:hypothetical protein